MPTAVATDRDLPRQFFTLVFLVLLLGSVFWILRPFLAALLWAATIVTATWPLRVAGARWLGGRVKLVVTLFTLGLLLAFMVPMFLAIGALVTHADQISATIRQLAEAGLPQAPGWLGRIPLVGAQAAAAWTALADSPLGDLAQRVTPYLGDAASWFAGQIGGLGMLLVQFLLTVVIAAVLWSSGASWAANLVRFAQALGGRQGGEVVVLAGQAVRAVALGVVVTAIVQSVLGGIGLAIAGIPLASALTVVMFLLCIAQIGPLPVLLAATGWLFLQEQTSWAVFLLVVSLVVGTMDNFLRPALIRRGADLPMLLILAGVIGGLMSFGLVGLFIGPVVLAVARTLLQAWLAAESGATESAAP